MTPARTREQELVDQTVADILGYARELSLLVYARTDIHVALTLDGIRAWIPGEPHDYRGEGTLLLEDLAADLEVARDEMKSGAGVPFESQISGGSTVR